MNHVEMQTGSLDTHLNKKMPTISKIRESSYEYVRSRFRGLIFEEMNPNTTTLDTHEPLH